MNRKRILLFVSGAIAFSLTACSTSNNSAQPKPTPSIKPACPEPSSEDRTTITQARADALTGMSESEAKACAQSLGWAFRVGSRDSEDFALTMDYSTGRVTVSVKKDKVFKVVVG